MASKALQVGKVGLNAVIAFVLPIDLKMHPSFNHGVNGGFERVCRHKFDNHAVRENAPLEAIKKRPDALSRAPRRLGDGLARQRPCDAG
jgi:hypothetical protein